VKTSNGTFNVKPHSLWKILLQPFESSKNVESDRGLAVGVNVSTAIKIC
jgi:hypothetical protein